MAAVNFTGHQSATQLLNNFEQDKIKDVLNIYAVNKLFRSFNELSSTQQFEVVMIEYSANALARSTQQFQQVTAAYFA